MKIKTSLKTIKQEIQNFLNDIFSQASIKLNVEEQKILMDIKSKGFYVIPNFYSERECVEIKNEIDNLLEKCKDQVIVDFADSDHRLWGADRVSPLISKFFTNQFINKIVHRHQKTDKLVGFTLAARLDYKPGNPGSGDGWHRDTAHSKQIKSILYLSDVNPTSGPFQYIKDSHRSYNVIRDMHTGQFDLNQSRFTDDEITKLLEKNKERLETFTAKAGTLILVNTRGLHRGMPIENSSRYALTNYFWSNQEIPSHLAKMIIKE